MQTRVRLVRFLRWTEQYAGTDMVYLFKGSFWMTASQVISALIALGLAVAFANLVSREVYGNYKYVLSLVGTVAAFSFSGVGTLVTQAVSKGFEGALRKASRTTLLWSIPMAVVSFGMGTYYALHQNFELSLSLIVAAFCTPLINATQLYVSFLQGKRDFESVAKFGVITSIVQAGSIFVALLMNAGIATLVATYFISIMLSTVSMYIYTLRTHRPNSAVDTDMFNFGVKLSLTNVLSTILSQIDKVLIFQFLGAAPVAVYTLAQAPIIQIRALLKQLTPLSLPKFAVQTPDAIARTLNDKTDKLLLVLVLIVVAYITAAPYLFKLFFPNYIDAVPYTQVYALVILLFPKKLVSLALYAQEYTRGQYAMATTAPVVQSILLIALIPLIGIWGAIVAEIAASIATILLANYYLGEFRRERAS